MSEQVKGVDVPNVTAWFEWNVPAAHGPLSFDPIAGGHSNLTYLVTDAVGHRFVLRRPPLGEVLATAHDMTRGHENISALGEGVYARYVGGSMGADASGFEDFTLQVERCADAAAEAVGRLG